MTTMTATDATELENGARATTPAADNALLAFARAEAAAYATLVAAAGGHTARNDELGIHTADAASPSPFGNIAHLTRPIAESEVDSLVATLRACYGERAGGPFLVFSPFPTPDLSAHGFHLAGHPPFMLRAPQRDETMAIRSGLRVVEVTTPAELEQFERTIAEAYPAPEVLPFGSQPRLFPDGVLGSGWHLFLAFVDAEPVATAASFVTDEIVVVEAVSTRNACRGRGYGAVVTQAATLAAPDRPAALVASDLGRGVYEQLGYVAILRYTLWVGTR
jgi:hypothetical protein